MMDKFIFLYGPPGAGKTAAGRHLAANLMLPFYDLDEMIQTRQKQSIEEIFQLFGEAEFRTIEKETLKELIKMDSGIVALGGGSLLDPGNRSLVENCGEVILLYAPPETLAKRLLNDPNPRPLVSNNIETHLERLLKHREGHYCNFQTRLETTNQTPLQSAWDCQRALGRYRVMNNGGGYDVHVYAGLLNNAGRVLHQLGHAGMVTVVSDENAGPLYAAGVIESLEDSGFSTAYVLVPAGEQFKSMETVEMLWDQFLKSGMGRDSLVVALGGGVVSDIAGFAAAAYLRGIPWAILPTTLLAMADASLGGKTGIDLRQGKNLVGAFHPPVLVLSDPIALQTLPKIELQSGMAEIVKHGVIADPHLFSLCEGLNTTDWASNPAYTLTDIIRRAVAVKVKIIQQDPLEKGVRAVLNLGHTIGHALEVTSNYKLNHGQAVSIGLVLEAQLSEELGLADTGTAKRISNALKNLGLPIAIPAHFDIGSVIEATQFDKKKRAGSVRFALPVRIGKVEHGIEINNLRRMHAFNHGHSRPKS